MSNLKILEVINQIPVVNLVPLFIKFCQEFPKLIDNVPQEKKQEFFNAFILASTKAMMTYAKNE